MYLTSAVATSHVLESNFSPEIVEEMMTKGLLGRAALVRIEHYEGFQQRRDVFRNSWQKVKERDPCLPLHGLQELPSLGPTDMIYFLRRRHADSIEDQRELVLKTRA